jgi:predicted ABC-type ATPase
MYLFGGPNGAGKTTVTLKVLPALGCEHFVNADMVASGLSPLNSDKAALQERMEAICSMTDEFRDEIIERAGREAVAEAIETHRRMGRPVVVWQNERVRWIRPEELEPRPLPGDDWQPPDRETE